MSDDGFFAELRRRHVIRAGIAHVLVGWLLIQFADVVMPYLGFVDEPVRWAFVVSVGTFPITILIAWFLEHPWHRYTGSRLAIDIIMIVAVALLAWNWAYRNLPESAQARTSIVILPFEHSGDAAEQGISRAIAYEVNSLLTKSKSIDVIGFQSSTSPVLEGLGAMGVADRLSVAHVLSGVVSLAGNNMRIDFSLSNDTGEPVLQSVIEDSVDNLFDVQERIAATIERRLGFGNDTVPVAEIAAGRCWKPTDPAALEKYYTARYYIELRTENELSKQQIKDAISLYRELVDKYPEFAEARSALAWALMHQTIYDPENAVEEPELGQTLRELAEQALADCPTLGEALHILPNEYDHENPWIGTHQQLTAFIEMQPEMGEYYQRLTRHYWDTGLTDRAIETAENNYAMNPLSVRAIRNLGSIEMNRDLDRAIELYDLAAELGRTGEHFPRYVKKLRDCNQDLECFIENLHPFFRPFEEPFRVIFRLPANEAEAEESRALAISLFRENPDQLLNQFTGAACEFDHLAPLTFELWDEARKMWKENGVSNPYWFWPNVWCDNVKTDPEFPRFAQEAMLVEYWNEVAFPPGCRADGDSVVCEAVSETARK